MDFLHGKTLLQRGTIQVPADVALKKKALILYYFTTGGNDSCRVFDLKLYDVYQQALIRKLEIGIIIVPVDNDKESSLANTINSYQDWFCLENNDDLIHILIYNYGVTHIPSLIVVKKNGTLVTKSGVKDIEEIGVNVLVTWTD